MDSYFSECSREGFSVILLIDIDLHLHIILKKTLRIAGDAARHVCCARLDGSKVGPSSLILVMLQNGWLVGHEQILVKTWEKMVKYGMTSYKS